MNSWVKDRLKGLVASAIIGVIAFQIRKGGTVSGLGAVLTPEEEADCISKGGSVIHSADYPSSISACHMRDPWVGTVFSTPPPTPRPVMDEMEKKKEALVKYGVAKRFIGQSPRCTKKNYFPKSNLRNCGFWNNQGGLTFDQAAMYVNRRLKGAM